MIRAARPAFGNVQVTVRTEFKSARIFQSGRKYRNACHGLGCFCGGGGERTWRCHRQHNGRKAKNGKTRTLHPVFHDAPLLGRILFIERRDFFAGGRASHRRANSHGECTPFIRPRKERPVGPTAQQDEFSEHVRACAGDFPSPSAFGNSHGQGKHQDQQDSAACNQRALGLC